MDRNEVSNKLNEVKAMNLPHMSYAKLKECCGNLSGFEETEENIRMMDAYLKKFLDPENDYIRNGCWLCGNKNVYLSWGLVHDVSHSNCCGLSYVEYHYPENICKGKKLFRHRIVISLQYHPDGFELNET